MPLPPLQPGDLPRPQTARERRAEAAYFAAEAANPPNQRPNIPPTHDPRFTRCPMSKYGVHRFVGQRPRHCEFCLKPYTDCVTK